MANFPETIEGTFEAVELWKVQSGALFMEQQLAEYQARKDGDTAFNTGGYPEGPSRVKGLYYRRRSDGAIFEIAKRSIEDDHARASLDADLKRLQGYKGSS